MESLLKLLPVRRWPTPRQRVGPLRGALAIATEGGLLEVPLAPLVVVVVIFPKLEVVLMALMGIHRALDLKQKVRIGMQLTKTRVMV